MLIIHSVNNTTLNIVLDYLLPCSLASSPIPSAQKQDHGFSILSFFQDLPNKRENKAKDLSKKPGLILSLNDERSSDRGDGERVSDPDQDRQEYSDTETQLSSQATGRICNFFHIYYYRIDP